MLKRLAFFIWLILNVVALVMWFRYVLQTEQEPFGYLLYFIILLSLNAPASIVGLFVVVAVLFVLMQLGADVEGILQPALLGVVCMSLGFWQWFILPGMIMDRRQKKKEQQNSRELDQSN